MLRLKPVTATANGQVSDARSRVSSLLIVGTASAGFVKLYDGTGTGDPLIVHVPTAAGVATVSVDFGGAALFKRGVYLEKSNVGDVTVFIER